MDRLCLDCYAPFEEKDGELSFAFSKEIPDFEKIENFEKCSVLDLFDTPVINVDFSNFRNLKKIRLSHCNSLNTLKLCNTPSLEVIDVSCSPHLSFVDISGSPSIKAFDASFCVSLETITGSLNQCKYFAVGASKISEFPALPEALYIDISATPVTSIDGLRSAVKCQYLNVNQIQTASIELGKYPELRELRFFACSCKTLDLEGIQASTKLTYISAKCTEVINIPDIQCLIVGKNAEKSAKFNGPVWCGDWHDAGRLLYGPWPSPPADLQPRFECHKCCDLPEATNKEAAADAIAGVFFGCACGDTLSIHSGNSLPEYINMHLNNPLDITWSHPFMTKRGSAFYRGNYTDETNMMLLFARSVCEGEHCVDPCILASNLSNWIAHGVEEHNEQCGLGYGPGTARAVNQPYFTKDPIAASIRVWEEGGKNSAGNAAIMRTGAAGCFMFWDEKAVIDNAELYSSITHPHPYCVYGSILVSLLISRFIQFRAGLIDTVDIDKTIEECFQYVNVSHLEKKILRKYTHARELEDLGLTNDKSAPTLKTMGCAVWCLRKNLTFTQCVEAVVRAGGDMNPNCSIVGACLGAKYGFSSLPKDVIQLLWYRFSVRKDLVPFLGLMGLEFDPYAEFHYSEGEDTTLLLRRNACV